MPFIPHTSDDVRVMLDAIDAPTLDALFDEIPPTLRIDELSALPLAGNRVRSGSLQSGLRSVVLGEGVFGHSPRVVAPYSLFLPSVTDLLIGVVRLKCPPIVGMK